MKTTLNKTESRAMKLAKIIYEAMVRYARSKKSLAGDKNPHLRLDISRIWRGNKIDEVDLLKNEYDRE